MAGSLVKRGDVWYARYELPRVSDGKRRQKMIACPGLNKRQAEEVLQETLRNVRTGTYIDVVSLNVSQYMHQWLAQIHADLAPATLKRYRDVIRLHIEPHIGGVTLAALRPLHVQLVCSRATERGLAPKTVNCIRGVLHAAFNRAVRLQIIAVNPVDAGGPAEAAPSRAPSGRRRRRRPTDDGDTGL